MARILIIDDDKLFREALAESVRDFGYDVVEASGAQEAIKLIEDADVAFLDLKMPNTSGIDFLREAKPVIPVIVLTTSDSPEDVFKAYDLNASSYITKPSDLDEFQRVMKTIRGFSLTVVKLPPQDTPL